MTTYFVDDGGSATSPYDTWAKAATSIQQLDTAITFASGDVVVFGADSNCTDNAAALTITGPTSGAPVIFVSSTVGSGSTISYSAGTGNQIITTGGTYNLTFDGSFALYGIKLKCGGRLLFSADSDELQYAENCTFRIGANQDIVPGGNAFCRLVNCLIDLTDDGTTTRSTSVFTFNTSHTELVGLTFTNPGYRTGTIFNPASAVLIVNGCDFSGFTQGALVISSGVSHYASFSNCLMPSTWTSASAIQSGLDATFVNCGPADAPESLYKYTYYGTIVSTASIYRTGGQSVESVPVSWLVTTQARCSESSPFYSPWMYALVSSTGAKTFDVYVVHDNVAPVAGDFDNSQVWLELEYLGTSDEASTTLATDRRVPQATATTSPNSVSRDETASTWVDNDGGIAPSFTYKQKLQVPATVNETGLFRVRVCVGVASITSSAFFYIDPKVTVT